MPEDTPPERTNAPVAGTPSPTAAPGAPPAEAAPPVEPGAKTIDAGEGIGRLPLPRRDRGEIYAVSNQLLGAARIRVMCEDNLSRMGRITGKMKKKMWIREGDLLIVRPWGFQEGKADILFRYSRTQSNFLSRRKMLPASVDFFGGELPPEPERPRRRR